MAKRIVAVLGKERTWVGEYHEAEGKIPDRLKNACQIFYIQAQNIQREVYMQTIPMKMGELRPCPVGEICDLDDDSPLMKDYVACWTNLVKPELLELPAKFRQ